MNARLRLLGPAAAATAGLLMVAWTWGTWPDPFIDFGRELYLPWQITEGRVLYRDLAHFNGPLSAYFNAAVFTLLGTRLFALVAVNLAIVAAVAFLLYRLAAAHAGPVAAAAAGITVLGVFAAGDVLGTGNFNWVCPYSHELTHGVALALVAVALFGRFLETRRAVWLAGAWALAGLVFLTKVEAFAALAAALGAGAILAALLDRPAWPAAARAALLAAGCAVAAPLAAWLALATAMGAWPAAAALRRPWSAAIDPRITSLPFYRWAAGLDEPGDSVRRLIVAAGLWLLVLAAVAGLSVLGRRAGRPRTFAAIAVAVIAAATAAGWQVIPFHDLLRPLPLLMAILGAASLARLIRERGDAALRRRLAARIVLIVFALALCAKILLNAGVAHYGFALALPATVVAVMALTGWLPALLAGRGGAAVVAQAAGLAVVILAAAAYGSETLHWSRLKTYPVTNGTDAFLADARGFYLDAAVKEVTARTGPGGTVIVMPEGVMVGYLARRAGSVPYFSFMPVELAIFGEDRMLAALRADPPDLVVLAHRDTAEYGVPFFGRDYGQALLAWVESGYRPVAESGDRPFEGDRFGVVVLERIGP